MKFRTSLIFLCILGFMACEGADGGLAGGDNPLDKCVIPAGASPGEEVSVQWNGFSSTAAISLKDQDGNVFPAGVKVVTSSGLIFNVPAGLAPGIYSVLLQGHGTPLGQMEVLPVDMPVAGLSFPSAVAPGEALVIKGTGFDSSLRLMLTSGLLQVELQMQSVPGGVSCNVPSDIPLGTYGLIMTDGEEEWTLEDRFMVAKRKRLVKIRTIFPHDDVVDECKECKVETNDGKVDAVVYTDMYLDKDGQFLETVYEYRYAQVEDWYFRIEGDFSEKTATTNFSFKYIFDETGRLDAIDAVVYTLQNPEHNIMHWYEYDNEGRPVAVSYEYKDAERIRQKYVYDSGNLVETFDYLYLYEDETLVNHPFAADAAHAFDMLMSFGQPMTYVPYLLGIHPFTSRLLPTRASTASKFEYEFDADGYVTQMAWNGGNAKICFVYE